VFSVKRRRPETYETSAGNCPFERWINGLDIRAQTRILGRLRRAYLGNFGSCRSLSDGLFEFKEEWGPGFRIYFALTHSGLEEETILVLWGGVKGSQERDVERAKRYWVDYQARVKGK
jgi:putative addiction module killer protein